MSGNADVQDDQQQQDATPQDAAGPATEPAVDYEALEARVSEGLNAAFGDGPADTEDEDTEVEGHEEADDDPQDGSEATDDPQTGEEEPGEEEQQQEPDNDGGEAAADDAPTLPAEYRRSLYAYGWKDEEIDQNLKALGPKFLDTAERIHQNRNTELSNWAAAGRAKRQEQQPPQDQQDPQGQADPNAAAGQTQDGLPSGLKAVDADELKKKYGDDELIDAIVGPVNAVVNSINAILPQIQQGQQTVQQNEIEQVSRQVESFFNEDDLKPYQPLYGSSQEGLTEEQLNARNKLLDTAYDLMAGAQVVHNRQLSLQEALQMGHEVVARDHKDTAVRENLKQQAKKRNKAIVQKPSRRQTTGDAPEPGSREALEKKVSKKLAEI